MTLNDPTLYGYKNDRPFNQKRPVTQKDPQLLGKTLSNRKRLTKTERTKQASLTTPKEPQDYMETSFNILYTNVNGISVYQDHWIILVKMTKTASVEGSPKMASYLVFRSKENLGSLGPCPLKPSRHRVIVTEAVLNVCKNGTITPLPTGGGGGRL